MAWTLVESGKIGTLPLDLYQSDGDYMIRVEGLELMNSRCHSSEEFLADCSPCLAANVLIAGLGLGYTLNAFLKKFSCPITVVEKSASVLSWYRKYFRAKFVSDDSRVQFVNAGVEEFIRTARESFDLIVLDVDNGPAALSSPQNEELYSSSGLHTLATRLRPGGAFLLWSSFTCSSFLARATDVGFHMRCQSVKVADGRVEHYIYIGQLPVQPGVIPA